MPAFKKGCRVLGRYWPWKGRSGTVTGFPVIAGERRVRIRWDDGETHTHASFAVKLAPAEPEPDRLACTCCPGTGYRDPSCPVHDEPEPEIQIRHRALAAYILTVARTRVDETWAAYVGVVRGLDHRMERHGVLELGTKLDEKVARALFPEFDGKPYAN